MKRIEFKRISKELIEEGITIDLLNKVQDSGKFSPAMMQKGDEPVTLIKANNESFWIQLDDGSFLKDNGKLMVFDIKNCIIARARYWLLFSDVEIAMSEKRKSEAKEKEIQREIERIQADVKRKAESYIKKFREIQQYAGVIESNDNILITITRSMNGELFKHKEDKAKEFIAENPNMSGFIDQIEKWIEESDFDSLYIAIENNGLPLITSMSNEMAFKLLPKFFHASKVDSTIELIKSQSHIKNVEMFNVNQRYV